MRIHDHPDAIGQALGRATLVVAMEVALDPDAVLRTFTGLRAGMAQPITGAIPPIGVRTALGDAGIGIVYAGIEIAHDDDPGWVCSACTDVPELDAVLFQADVLPECRGSWSFLRDRAPEYADEFQIADLDELGRTRPLVVDLGFSPENVRQITGALPHVRGIALTLAGRARRSDARFHRYADAVRVPESLRTGDLSGGR